MVGFRQAPGIDTAQLPRDAGRLVLALAVALALATGCCGPRGGGDQEGEEFDWPMRDDGMVILCGDGVPTWTITVTHIKYDHKVKDAGFTDALDIRLDAANDLKHLGDGAGPGEWITPGPSRVKSNEPALYIANKAVTVKVRLECTGPIQSADIEAKSRNPGQGLRNLNKQTVAFANGVSQPEYVEFVPGGNTSTTIKRVEDSWQWRATNIVFVGGGINPGPIDITLTGPHTVYTVLEEPKTPWYRNAQQHPWASALEFAIRTAGADGKQTVADAAARFTDFAFGEFGAAYDSDGLGGAAYFTQGSFNLTGYMTKSAHPEVNCEDHAGVVITLTNLMGGDAVAHLLDPYGYMNPVALAGLGQTNNPYFKHPKVQAVPVTGVDDLAVVDPATGKIKRSYFSYHVWAELGGNVYDATVGPYKGMAPAAYLAAVLDTSTPAEAQVRTPVKRDLRPQVTRIR